MPEEDARRRHMTDQEFAAQLMETCLSVGMTRDQARVFIIRMLKNRRADEGSA